MMEHLRLFTAFFLGIAVKRCSSLSTNKFQTVSGLPVSRYGLGGAARSTQPSTLPELYCELLRPSGAAPFFFYYNPHRYPLFLAGVQDIFDIFNYPREDIFVACGGTDRSPAALDQRLKDALQYCDGKYLDMFVLEYICPEELSVSVDDEKFQKDPTQRLVAGNDLQAAIDYIRENWINQDDQKVRYLAISTHSHVVGTVLARHSGVDAMMLRYGMSHKDAAENLSFPSAQANEKPVIAFTSTRWNALQEGHADYPTLAPPTSTDCLAFALAANPPVEMVLHSARDEVELQETLGGLLVVQQPKTMKDMEQWRGYGALFEEANADFFDEYPEERFLKSSN